MSQSPLPSFARARAFLASSGCCLLKNEDYQVQDILVLRKAVDSHVYLGVFILHVYLGMCINTCLSCCHRCLVSVLPVPCSVFASTLFSGEYPCLARPMVRIQDLFLHLAFSNSTSLLLPSLLRHVLGFLGAFAIFLNKYSQIQHVFPRVPISPQQFSTKK